MALSDELAYMSASELALRIRRRDFSPVEVVDALITRIEARNPSINAFVYFGFEDARKRVHVMVTVDMGGWSSHVRFEMLELGSELLQDVLGARRLVRRAEGPSKPALSIEQARERLSRSERLAEAQNEMKADRERGRFPGGPKRVFRRRRIDQ